MKSLASQVGKYSEDFRLRGGRELSEINRIVGKLISFFSCGKLVSLTVEGIVKYLQEQRIRDYEQKRQKL